MATKRKEKIRAKKRQQPKKGKKAKRGEGCLDLPGMKKGYI